MQQKQDTLKRESLDILGTDKLTYFLAKEKGISQVQYDTVNFLFFFIFYLEKIFEDQVVKLLKKGMISDFLQPDIFSTMYSEMNFLGKIKIFKIIVGKNKQIYGKYKPFIKFAQSINAIRNELFHFKLKQKILFDNKDVSLVETQRDMVWKLISLYGGKTN